MIDTLLFDLDGTLVDVDKRGIAWHFLKLVWPLLKGLPPHRRYLAARAAVNALKTHGSRLTNLEAMIAALGRTAGWDARRVEACVADFESAFGGMRSRFKPVEGAQQAVALARRLGYRLALATNPTSTLAMIEQRLACAGFGALSEWAFVTHAGNMTRCKPQVDYYREIVARWALVPERCLMIGNEAQQDLPAAGAGLHTFLIDRGRVDWLESGSLPWTADHQGSYAALEAWLMKNARLFPLEKRS